MDWTKLSVSADGTHHLYQGRSSYTERFDEVLKFHAPGLAPVRRHGHAWHIHPDGQAAYARRFMRTFGFYEGLATVVSGNGWHHIDHTGKDAYPGRHAWCGNFQEGRCTVRTRDGRYQHLLPDGSSLAASTWRYAGDYKDGICVVQHDDGRSTHLDATGLLLHRRWFLDLDVFHKGSARARDEGGWTHIDLDGLPRYARRFATVEPFYNGQARVERLDGGLEVIDEHGDTLVELRPARQSAFAQLSADMVGFWKTQAIAAAVESGVIDALPGSAQEIAARLALDEQRCRRLMFALGELGLVTLSGMIWKLSMRGQYLRSDHVLTLADAALEYGSAFTQAWQQLPAALRAGPHWTAPTVFHDVAADAARRRSHHRMLASYARHDYATLAAELRLAGVSHVIDAGGGTGVLSALLLKTYSGLKVTLLDLPAVVAEAKAGGGNTQERLHFQGGDLFSPWGLRADAVVLARVLHDWDDRQALTILAQARDALAPGGQLFIVELMLSESSFAGRLCDLHLLMATGGQERTVDEYRQLMMQGGFTFCEQRQLNALTSILVGVTR